MYECVTVVVITLDFREVLILHDVGVLFFVFFWGGGRAVCVFAWCGRFLAKAVVSELPLG